MEDGGIAELAGHVWITDVWAREHGTIKEDGERYMLLEQHWKWRD